MAEITGAEGVVDFFFEKSAQFRVMHVDGAIGSIAPGSQFIHMAVFSERTPIPKQQSFVLKNGFIQSEVVEKRISKTGVYREVEADLVLSIATAVGIRDWLTSRINEIQEVALKAAAGSK